MLTDLKAASILEGREKDWEFKAKPSHMRLGGQKDGSAVQSTEDHLHQGAYNDLSLQLQGAPTPLVSSSTAVTYIQANII